MQIRVLPMRAGNLKGLPCHNCGKEANYRTQYYGPLGWETKYYECGSWRCQQATENKVNAQAISSG